MAHIVATISGHGFGHLSISAPILNRLHQENNQIQITVISGLSETRLRSRILVPFDYQTSTTDSGVVMNADLSVNVTATVEAYGTLHADYERHTQQLATQIKNLNCDLVLSNVSYLSLAAANHLGLPALAVCSLNWADIYHHFCHQLPQAQPIHGQMLADYNSANMFLKTTPSMPMPALRNAKSIGPVAALGCNRKSWICEQLGVDPTCLLVLIAMGGHDLKLVPTWPIRGDIHWLVPESWNVAHPTVSSFEGLGLPFIDILSSCHAMIGKPGYGSFTEAACAGVPVLYCLRPDWPEESYLVSWLKKRNICAQLEIEQLQDGTFVDELLTLINTSRDFERPAPTGITDAAQIIERLL